MHHRAATDECVLDRRTLERFAALFAVRRGLTAETGEEHRLTYTTGGGSDD